MRITFSSHAWEDYTTWLKEDRKMLVKINQLIKDIQRTPYDGIGKPEALKYDLAGYWSRRFDREHRLVYKVENDTVIIISCKYHYD
jgi:toxin YoeB